ncbi:hypothetical protein HBH86_045740 [Parastagonospora nodorum]|nr:hypothetical protein HBH93_035970 [Parastagonospora nodorum]KAH4551364.1 hypothetical protein HBH85_030910 [Parastagonospora nodorum]KAH4564262.1 hypothetical protein HBH86_045740 [Parastagonospora nodorum]KAH5813645.1 hypothetical protein HBI94_141610 [Parastagonospora nodorum]KAH5825214.1 hypothetical protein HBI93_157510 [Parastagonospora nodorum]
MHVWTIRTTYPVCSALFKHRTGGLVVKWVTISGSPLLNGNVLHLRTVVCFTGKSVPRNPLSSVSNKLRCPAQIPA